MSWTTVSNVYPASEYTFTAPYATLIGVPQRSVLLTTSVAYATGVDITVRSTTTLPAGLSADSTYYVKRYSTYTNQFEVALTEGGTTVALTSKGTGTHYVKEATPDNPSMGWQQLSSVTQSDGGVDFVMRVDDQFPLRLTDARPSYIIDNVETP